jgi:hypothetical protein
MPTINDEFALHPLSEDEKRTCESMLAGEESSRVLIMPTHHICPVNMDMSGFRFDIPGYAPGSLLPINRMLFHGHTVVECQNSEEMILDLMKDKEGNRRKMRAFLSGIHERCVKPADMDCIPDNSSRVMQSGRVNALGMLSADARAWDEELPERIGIYHAYIRGLNRDQRTHKYWRVLKCDWRVLTTKKNRMFIVCSGGMTRASDKFFNTWSALSDARFARLNSRVTGSTWRSSGQPKRSARARRGGGCEKVLAHVKPSLSSS